MNCASMQDLLSSWLDHELTEDLRAQVEQHVKSCSSCQSAVNEMKRLDLHLRSELTPSVDEVQKMVSATLAEYNKVPFRPRLSGWRTLAIAVASAAAGFLLAVVVIPEFMNKQVANRALPTSSQAVAEMPVQLALAIGPVEMEEEGMWKPLPTGARLSAGQRIRTLERSRCELRCSDGSEIRLNNGSEVVIHSPRLFTIEKGQVWSTVAADPTPFQVKTGLTTVTALGTQFDIAYCDQRTTLSVLEGKTKFELAGKSAEVRAGQQLQLDNRQGTFDIREPDYALYQATNWVHEILILKGRDNPELNRRINDLMAAIGETKMSYMAEDEIRTLGDHCVVPLCRFLESPRSKPLANRRQLAAKIVSDLAQPRSISDLIDLLTDEDGQVRVAIVRGLNRLTKQNLGMSLQQWQSADHEACKRSQAQWRQWWKSNQHRYPEA